MILYADFLAKDCCEYFRGKTMKMGVPVPMLLQYDVDAKMIQTI
jgi:hypothetical protein